MRQAGYIVRMMTPFSPQLLKPDVELEHNPLRLVSRDFGDIYFSVEDGLAETDLVFIDGNDLISRMKTSKHLVVAETGFGTGLNFLALLRHWKRLGEDAPHLHFISTEIAPLPNDLIRTVLSAIPEIAEDVEMLVKALPPHWPGRHRRHFFDGKVTLDLYYGDSVTMRGFWTGLLLPKIQRCGSARYLRRLPTIPMMRQHWQALPLRVM